MKLIRTFLTSALLLGLGAQQAWSADFTLGPIEMNDPWIRASVTGQTNGAGYIQFKSTGAAADKLISAQSEAATTVELHTVITENGVAKMQQVPEIIIPSNGSVNLAPGGYHIMFLKLTAPFKQDSTIPVVLKFEKAGEIRVNFTVKPSTYNPGKSGNNADSHMGHSGGMKH